MAYNLYSRKAFLISGFAAAIAVGALIGARIAAVSGDDHAQGACINTFVHPDFGFSFDYPQSMKIDRSAYGVEPYSEMITVADKETQMDGFYISMKTLESDEEGWRAIQKIIDEVRADKMEKKITVGGIEAVVASAHDGEMPLVDVWFVHHKRFYEIRTHAALADELMDILNTWRFHD